MAETRPIGKYERLAYERNERDLALARQPGGHPRAFRYDPEAAERPVIFLERYCKHHKGEWAGKPLLQEEWEKFCIRATFGWKLPSGLRRFRTSWWEVPRKNGKTEEAGGLGLYLEAADGEPGAEVYSTATKRDQPKIVWDTAAGMVKASPELRRFLKVWRASITCERMAAKFEPLSADSGTLDGLNPHAHIPDEVHAHKDPRVWAVMDTAMGARRQPLTLAITTAGIYDPDALGWQQHDYAVKVLEGVVEDDSFFAFIAAADEGDDPFAVETQRKANPNYGVSVKPDYLANQAQKAQLQPSFLNEYLRLHLNVWTQQVTRWLNPQHWNACQVSRLDLERLRGRSCIGGLDLSSVSDLTALVLVFEEGEDGILPVFSRFWLPEETVRQSSLAGRRHYEKWVKDGWLRATPGNVIDYDFIRREVNEVGEMFDVEEIAFDPYNSTQIANDLQADGFILVKTRQGFLTLSEPAKFLEVKVTSEKLRYDSPVLRWCGLNVAIDTDASGNIKPVKDVKRTNKIDGISALVTALSRRVQGTGDGGSYLDHEEVLAV